ncbi:hypothetical protein ABLE68_21330 [Nocardioides sp. CN2-186]|uniref:hypothetical protein n=1 Tax=Nocardioides tweenelious TaxID=3156607 RepID=UPI0032B317EE
MVVVWIVIGVVVLALAAWAFFPHRRGVVDSELKLSQKKMQGRTGMYDNNPY